MMPDVPPAGPVAYEDVNMDTVKSLRHFLDTNRMLKLGGGCANRAGSSQSAAIDICSETTTPVKYEEEKQRFNIYRATFVRLLT
jgi:hypothetical protein